MNRKWIGWGTAVSLLVLLLAACSTSEPDSVAEAPVQAAPPKVVEETKDVAEAPVLPTPTEVVMPQLPDLGAAPEIVNQTWLNTDEPVTIASQRGKVILLEFWTFG